MEVRLNQLDAERFLSLYASVGWEPPCREQVERALENTLATFTVYDGETAVGMARLIGDGGMSYYVKDLAVLPAWQGRGAGRLLIEAIESYIRANLEKGWAVSLELISTLEARRFYEKMGFEARPCEWDGPGMFKMLR